MEGSCTDPYEAQLLAVFESCKSEDQSGLDEHGLHSLCDKLQLEERGKELVSCLLERKPTLKFVSFHEFRDALLTLLGKVQDGISSQSDHEFSNESLQCLSSTRISTRKYGRRTKPKEENREIGNYQHPYLDDAKDELWKDIDRLLDIKIDESKLQELWSKLSIGSDQSELTVVSQLIGIPMLSKPIVERIFEKLDTDHDGRISLEEFFLIFKSGKSLQEHLGSGWNTESRNDIMKQDSEKDSIQFRGPHHTGFARSSTIVDMWEVAGVADAATLLAELGFTSPDLSLTELTIVLSEELKSLRDESDNRIMGTHISLLKAALVLYQEEVRSLNVLVEHLSGERDKLRGDITEANQRASLLAQEVDENHVRLEKSSQNQIKQLELKNAEIVKDLTNQLRSERESNTAILKLMDERLQALQIEDQRIRTELANVLAENNTLEKENQNLSEHLSKLRLSNNQLQIQIQMLAAEHDEVENVDAKENELVLSLMDRIKKLQSDNSLLCDQYDELTSEMESMKSRDTEVTNSSEMLGLQDYPVKQPATSTIEGKNTGTDSDVLSTFDENTIQSNQRTSTNVYSQEHTLAELRSILRNINKELASIITERSNNCLCDNCVIRYKVSEVINRFDLSATASNSKDVDTVKSLANELEAECEERATESLRDLVINKPDLLKLGKKTNADDLVQNIDRNSNNLDTKNIMKDKKTSLRDYPPRRDETVADQSKTVNSGVANSPDQSLQSNDKSEFGRSDNTKDSNDFTKIVEILKETEEKHTTEKQLLIDRCTELENSIDLLRSEYEQCEDYWSGKLEEERQLFDQEQRISDEKFSELIAKMAEYEEQFGSGDKSRDDGRLSPIEERFNLEQQYTDLEEEYNAWKSQASADLAKKQEEIEALQEQLQRERREKRLLNVDFSMQFPDPTNTFASNSVNPKPIPTFSPSQVTLPTQVPEIQTSPRSYSDNAAANVFPSTSESFEFNHVSENVNLNNGSSPTSPRRVISSLHGCNCHQLQSHSVLENLCRAHRDELRRLHQLKVNLDAECGSLLNQKEMLMQEILKLQSFRTLTCSCAPMNAGEQACRIDLNVLQALNARLQTQEQKCRHLQTLLKQQQQHTERILHQTWKQHRSEITDLQFVLRNTQEKLQQQLQTLREQNDRLVRSDLMVKDLYLENTYLLANMERLQQHCHNLTQYNAESTSV